MNIRFNSSLTPDDENRIAAALLRALAGILDALPIAYVLRIDTSDDQVYQHTGPLFRTGAASSLLNDAAGPSAPSR